MVVPPARVRLAVLFSQALVRGDDPEHQLPDRGEDVVGFRGLVHPLRRRQKRLADQLVALLLPVLGHVSLLVLTDSR
jgi:hypothetical protein